jgi:hypothetical protein
MKSATDFLAAIAKFFSFEADSATPSEVHAAFLESTAKNVQTSVDLTAANGKIAAMQTALDAANATTKAVQAQLAERDATIAEQDAKIEKLAKVQVTKTGATSEQNALKGDEKEYKDADAPRW